ncbi:MAG: RluA family pseudouridine synthase, partial [Pseudomonadota bacterium]
MTQERFITVAEDDDGQRFDRWLKKHVPDIPYGLSQKLIRKGAFKIDGKKAKADARLSGGQEIRIPAIENAGSSDKKKRDKPLSEKDKAMIKDMIIYQDEDIIALNKPSGLAVQGGTKTKQHVDRLIEALTDKKGVKPRLVHRLDKDTSGVLLLARSAKIAKIMGEQFKKQQIRKIYWAIVTPSPEQPRGAIRAPLAKAGGTNKERVVIDEEDGKFALTEYDVIEEALDTAAFVAFWPKTGRTHQIRAHAEIMGTPILGDPKYKGEPQKIDHNETGTVRPIKEGSLDVAKQLHLHAREISWRLHAEDTVPDTVALLSAHCISHIDRGFSVQLNS